MLKKLLFLLVALSILWTWQAMENPASAHGGSYRGPAGEVPPGSRDPKDPQPPPENPTTPTPPGGNPTPTNPGGTPTGGDGAPPPESPKPKAPANGGPTGPGPIGGTATPGGKVNQPKPMSFENWLFWWGYNKDEILNLKAAIKNMDNKVSTTGSAHFFGDRGGKNRSETKAPTEALIKQKVIPVLQQVIANKEIHPDIRGGAVIALARAGGQAHVGDILNMAKVDGGEDKLVQESAIIALGILQLKNPDIRKFLIDFIDNMEAPWRARCFACLAIGLLQDNSDEAFAALERRVDGRESTPDVPVCATMAIGLIGDAKKVPMLIEWLETARVGKNRLSDLEKAYVVGALGKIGEPSALKTIEGTLRKKDALTRRSAMIAFGQILPQADVETQQAYVKKLAAFLKNESDTTSMNFGIMALGRIAGEADASEQVRKTAVAVLLRQFKTGGKATERPYAALALGLVAFQRDAKTPKPQELKYEIAAALRPALKKLSGDKVSLGAIAIALGMVGDKNP